jgi:hypothetical protein
VSVWRAGGNDQRQVWRSDGVAAWAMGDLTPRRVGVTVGFGAFLPNPPRLQVAYC